jgi:predicted alpha-1,2-mannosidase
MVQLSPDTGHPLGYRWSHRRIEGFSHTHLSGAGCPTMGDIPFMPTTGAVRETRADRYASSFSHASENARPGDYRVRLDRYRIDAELTATTRTGWHRYKFPATKRANVLVNVGDVLRKSFGSRARVLGNRRIVGEVTDGGFCGSGNRYTVHFSATFNRPFTARGTWRDGVIHPGSGVSFAPGAGRSNGAYVTFDTRRQRTVIAKVALSYIDRGGADRNMAAEARGFNFNAVRTRAAAVWHRALSRIRIGGGTASQRTAFYSALYRAQLGPTTFSDVDGRYAGFDGKVHAAGRRTQYANLSLWDTYRPQNQLLALLVPDVARDVQLSLLADAQQNGGWLPRWPMASGDTNVMTGDPAAPFLVDGWSKGLLRGHEEEALGVLWRNANRVPPWRVGTLGRIGNAHYVRHGYVPHDPSEQTKGGDGDLEHGASATLEYALSDCSVAMMADGLGHPRKAATLYARAGNYRSIWDPRSNVFRARTREGGWVASAAGVRGSGFHEGGPWQYRWLVPQDMRGLVEMLGGRRRAAADLDHFFSYPSLLTDPAGAARRSWVSGPYAYYGSNAYNPNNEPDLHAPWAYAWVGQPWKTSDVLRAARTLFAPRPDGLTGNDDLGTMSAWYVFAALGFYPVTSGGADYVLHAPLFPHATVQLPRGRTLTIAAPGASDSNRYVQGLRVGGRDWRKPWLAHEDLLRAGTLGYTVGSRAGASWGRDPEDAPPSPCSRRGSARDGGA